MSSKVAGDEIRFFVFFFMQICATEVLFTPHVLLVYYSRTIAAVADCFSASFKSSYKNLPIVFSINSWRPNLEALHIVYMCESYIHRHICRWICPANCIMNTWLTLSAFFTNTSWAYAVYFFTTTSLKLQKTTTCFWLWFYERRQSHWQPSSSWTIKPSW